jgi:hypothetical protein
MPESAYPQKRASLMRKAVIEKGCGQGGLGFLESRAFGTDDRSAAYHKSRRTPCYLFRKTYPHFKDGFEWQRAFGVEKNPRAADIYGPAFSPYR